MSVSNAPASVMAAPAAAKERAKRQQPPPRHLVTVEKHDYPEVEAFKSGVPVRYSCENGDSFAVRFDKVRGTSTAQVRYADGFANETRRTLLLVAGPTGSGVRYTNDEAVLHLKGDQAWIDIPESASNDAFAASSCRQETATGQEPLTQGALAGSYFFAIDRFYPGQYDHAHFEEAEVICFIAADADFYALVPALGEFPARYYVSHGADLLETGPMLVGKVDAGVGQRAYPIDMGYPGTLALRFAAPGSIDGTVRAMAGLSSIDSNESERLDCLDGGDYLYVGLFDDRTVSVELTQEGSLVYRAWMKGSEGPANRIEGGHVAIDQGRTTFHFLDEDGTLVQAIGAEDGEAPPDAYFVHGPAQWLEQQARAYFIADRDGWRDKTEVFPSSYSHLISALEICNHLAGEGGDEQRNLQVGRAQEKYGCEALGETYDRALREFPKGSRFRTFLEANAPVWR